MDIAQAHARVERFRFIAFDSKESAASAATKALAEPAAALIAPEFLSQVLAEPPAPLPPSFSEEQMEQAKQEAYQKGLTAGKQQAEAERNKAAEEQAAAIKALLQMLPNQITLASEGHQKFLTSQHEIMQKLAMAIARKVAGDALKREPTHSVETLLKECMELFAGNERIVIFVAVQRYEGLKQSIDSIKPLLKDFKGEVIIEGDKTLGEYDCRVEWKSGAALHSSDHLWAEIENIVKKTALSS